MPKFMRAAVLGGVVLLSGGLVGVAVPDAWAQPRELPAQIVTLGGAAEMNRKDTPAWKPATLRADVGEGDSVRTQLGGRVTIRTASGQALRLGSRSQIACATSHRTRPGPTSRNGGSTGCSHHSPGPSGGGWDGTVSPSEPRRS